MDQLYICRDYDKKVALLRIAISFNTPKVTAPVIKNHFVVQISEKIKIFLFRFLRYEDEIFLTMISVFIGDTIS